MRHLLVVAYGFPPLGGGGVQRTLGFARHLLERGWRSIVITASSASHAIYSTSGRWTDHLVAMPAALLVLVARYDRRRLAFRLADELDALVRS